MCSRQFKLRSHPRPSAGLEQPLAQKFSSSAAEHRLGTSPLHHAIPPPRASDGTTSQPKLGCECQFLIGSCIFSDFYEFPRARHATVTSVSPSKPVAPFVQVAESYIQR